jgi:hypothetical protein
VLFKLIDLLSNAVVYNTNLYLASCHKAVLILIILCNRTWNNAVIVAY